MEYAEIAKSLGISESRARGIVTEALHRIEQAGDMEGFATVVRLTHLKAAGEVNIRCGSIECRPEKWAFF
jgi:hypothetical protein